MNDSKIVAHDPQDQATIDNLLATIAKMGRQMDSWEIQNLALMNRNVERDKSDAARVLAAEAKLANTISPQKLDDRRRAMWWQHLAPDHGDTPVQELFKMIPSAGWPPGFSAETEFPDDAEILASGYATPPVETFDPRSLHGQAMAKMQSEFEAREAARVAEEVAAQKDD